MVTYREKELRAIDFNINNPDYVQFTTATMILAGAKGIIPPVAKYLLHKEITENNMHHIKIGKRIFLKKEDVLKMSL